MARIYTYLDPLSPHQPKIWKKRGPLWQNFSDRAWGCDDDNDSGFPQALEIIENLENH